MTDTHITAGAERRHFEDYLPGSVAEYGAIEVSADEIVAFGLRFDPQPFHVDEDLAARSDFGGLIASGWHTASLMMRLLVDNFLSKMAGLGSPGIDQLRWLAPVRPGDRLSIRVGIEEARRLRSRPDRGMLRLAIEVLNQSGVVVMTVNALTLVRCRADAVEPRSQAEAP